MEFQLTNPEPAKPPLTAEQWQAAYVAEMVRRCGEDMRLAAEQGAESAYAMSQEDGSTPEEAASEDISCLEE